MMTQPKRLIIFCACLIICLIFSSSLCAGEKNYQIVLVSGEKLPNIYIKELRGDSLSVDDNGGMRLLAVDDIAEIFRSNKSTVRRNGAIGVLLGGAVGAAIGAATWDELDADAGVFSSSGVKALIYGLGGALAGGLLGAIVTPKYERYSFSGKTREEKLKIIEEKLLPKK